jgi:hypothetical protein
VSGTKSEEQQGLYGDDQRIVEHQMSAQHAEWLLDCQADPQAGK